MEKISGIIPSSPRLSSVDLNEASPVRPGTPSFGRPQGVSTLSEPSVSMDTARKGAAIHREMMDWRSKDERDAAMVAEMSNRFFVKNQRRAEKVVDIDSPSMAPTLQTSIRSNPAGFKTDEVGSLAAVSSLRSDIGRPDVGFESDVSGSSVEQPAGLYPKGSFIDYSV